MQCRLVTEGGVDFLHGGIPFVGRRYRNFKAWMQLEQLLNSETFQLETELLATGAAAQF